MNSLIVFTKAPVPGKVKTRLCPPLSGEQAAQLYRAFVGDVLTGAHASGAATVTLAYETHPDYPDPSWSADSSAWFPQAGGDLGARLIAAFNETFKTELSKTVIIGTDCPDLDPHTLSDAFARLGRADAVVGPANDGGYYLIGLRRPMPHLFIEMEWSGSKVLQSTLERLRLRGMHFERLPLRSDVDTFEDLKALEQRLSETEGRALLSREAIRGLRAQGLFGGQ